MWTLPIFVLLFIPVVLGMSELYHWTDAEHVSHDPILQGKEPWLNRGFFLIRAGFYFLLWIGMATWFRAGSVRQDETGDESLTRSRIFFAGPSIAIFALSTTFAAFDWAMSLDPHWYSTMFGVYYFAGCLVAIFATLYILAFFLDRAGYLRDVVTVEHRHDLGKLLFAFTVFWTYIAFSQFFLIWYANIPEETLWYLHRLEGSWRAVTLFLSIGHFAVPFLFLMPRTIKRQKTLLLIGACWMLFMHLLDMHWLVMPNLHAEGFHLSLLDLTTLLAVGGVFVGGLGWALCRSKLIPIRDPRVRESLSFENM